MAKLTSMMNIGQEMAKKLDSVGIDTAEELIRMSVWYICMHWRERSVMWNLTVFRRAGKRS